MDNATNELGHEQLHAGGPSRDESIAVLPQQPWRQPYGPALLVVSGTRHVVERPRLTQRDVACGGKSTMHS